MISILLNVIKINIKSGSKYYNIEINICTGMDEAEAHLAARDRVHLTETLGTWPRGRNLGNLGREAETMGTWPRGRDLGILG